MSVAHCYASLARTLDYPEEKGTLLDACEAVAAHFRSTGVDCPLGPFADFVVNSPVSTIQEEYVATFDFNPATAPYLGHHLFGDNQKKGEYMIGLKSEYGRHGFIPSGNELPDHLPQVLEFLAHLARHGDADERRSLIAGRILPGVERLSAGFAARHDSPWKPLVDAVGLLCAADCKEVAPC